jgi:hypothetical protein
LQVRLSLDGLRARAGEHEPQAGAARGPVVLEHAKQRVAVGAEQRLHLDSPADGKRTPHVRLDADRRVVAHLA